MKELCIWNQSYFKEKGKLEPAEIVQTKENKSIEYLNFSLGLMTTIKPLVKCLCTFTRLKDLRISNVNLYKLHFLAIDNYLIANSNL